MYPLRGQESVCSLLQILPGDRHPCCLTMHSLAVWAYLGLLSLGYANGMQAKKAENPKKEFLPFVYGC